MILLRLRGTSESSAAIKRKRSCLASKDGELRLESADMSEKITRYEMKAGVTINALCDCDYFKRFHPC